MTNMLMKMLVESEAFHVPVGYSYTSDRGTEYYKSSTGWRNETTDKSIPDKEAERVEMAATADAMEYNKAHPTTPIGGSYADGDGVTYYYTGNDFVSNDGRSLDPSLVDKATKKITSDAKKKNSGLSVVKPVADTKADEKVANTPANVTSDKPATNTTKKVASPAPVNEPATPVTKPSNKKPVSRPSPAPVQNDAEKNVQKQTTDNVTNATPVSAPAQVTKPVRQPKETGATKQPAKSDVISDKINKLADNIKNNPEYQRIKALLRKGDKLSLLAADIILSGKRAEAKDQISQKLGA